MLDKFRAVPKDVDTGREQMLLFLCCALGVGWGTLAGRLTMPLEAWLGPALFLLVMMAVLSQRPFYAGVNTMAFFICLFVNGHIYSTLVPSGYAMLQETLLRLLWVAGVTALGTVLWAAAGNSRGSAVITGLAAGMELPLVLRCLQLSWVFSLLSLLLMGLMILLLQKSRENRLTAGLLTLLSGAVFLLLSLVFRL